ncbi:DAAM2 [Branchiostoma lanceolatum]|uniref:DAAM2 protein n=1 Tax=Branchiostoma lanceolatum TaxID=7740 RepID=A0A8K0A5W0_BRALA|nr:DAAM2 [Branchiostoma lanceolatum]
MSQSLTGQLSNEEQLWLLTEVKENRMTQDEAVQYARERGAQARLEAQQVQQQGGGTPQEMSKQKKKGFFKKHSFSGFGKMPQMPTTNMAKMFRKDSKSSEDQMLKAEGQMSEVSKNAGLVEDLMRKEGMSAEEMQRESLAFSSVEVKEGDAVRSLIGNLVKRGRMTIEDAMQYAKDHGLAEAERAEKENIAEASSAFQQRKVYNFTVYKFFKHRTSQRRILQIDFDIKVLRNIQRGNVNNTFQFDQIAGSESAEGLRFFIYFEDYHEYELNADNLEEKNKILRLLNIIVEQNKCEKEGETFQPVKTLPRAQAIIKEGELEKRAGTALLRNQWNRRWVRIRQGELSYYKLAEESQTALNIIHLNDESVSITPEGDNGFCISTNKEHFSFRVPNPNQKEGADIQAVRDEWFKVLSRASQDYRRSAAHVYDHILTDDFFNQATSTTTVHHLTEEVGGLVKKLQVELEQLQSVLTILDAQEATTQMTKLKEIASSLDNQLRDSGLPGSLTDISQKSLTQRDSSDTSDSLKRQDSSDSEESEYMDMKSPVILKTRPESGPFAIISGDVSVQEEDRDSEDVSEDTNGEKSVADMYSKVNKEKPAVVPPPLPLKRKKSLKDGDKKDEDAAVEEKGGGDTKTEEQQDVTDSSDIKDNGEVSANGELSPESATLPRPPHLLLPSGLHTPPSGPPTPPPSPFLARGKCESPPPIGGGGPPTPPSSPVKTEDMHDEISMDSVKERLDSSVEIDQTDGADVLEKNSSGTQEASPDSPPPPTSPVPQPPATPTPPPLPTSPIPTAPPLPVFNRGARVKLRPFHWTKIPTNMLSKTIWKQAQDRSADISVEVLEKNFALTDRDSPDSGPVKVKKKAKLLLDSKMAHNLAIFLTGFKVGPGEFTNKLLIIGEEEGGLTMEQINSVRRFLPTSEEQELFRSYHGDRSELESSDRFMLEMCSVPMVEVRLDLLMVMAELPEQIQDLTPTIHTTFGACQELVEQKHFHQVLEYVLAVGNRINMGTTRGAARGFRLASLSKLSETYSSDRASSLLQFVVEQIKQKEPQLLDVSAEMHCVQRAAGASVKGLMAEMEVMTKDLLKAKKHVSYMKKKKNSPSKRDLEFCKEVEEKISAHEKELNALQKQCSAMRDTFNKVLGLYGELPGTDSQEVFSAVSEFLASFDIARDKLREEEEKRNDPRKKLGAIMQGSLAGAAVKLRSPTSDHHTMLTSLRDTLPAMPSPDQDNSQDQWAQSS